MKICNRFLPNLFQNPRTYYYLDILLGCRLFADACCDRVAQIPLVVTLRFLSVLKPVPMYEVGIEELSWNFTSNFVQSLSELHAVFYQIFYVKILSKFLLYSSIDNAHFVAKHARLSRPPVAKAKSCKPPPSYLS